jgi:hypothetical protein
MVLLFTQRHESGPWFFRGTFDDKSDAEKYVKDSWDLRECFASHVCTFDMVPLDPRMLA